MATGNNTQKQYVEVLRPLDDLIPCPYNPRRISEAQFQRLKAQIQKHGLAGRIEVTQDMRIISGHQRVMVLKELGYTEAPVLMAPEPMTEEEYKERILAANHNNGEDDVDILANHFDLAMIDEVGKHDFMPLAKEQETAQAPGKSNVRCPNCSEEFPVKGNKVLS